MMLHLCCLMFSLLWSLSFSSSGLQCNDKQYEWPVGNPEKCCPKCEPGHRYIKHLGKDCEIQCDPCDENRYMDIYNKEGNCNVCDVCIKENFEVVSNCTRTQNTVCKCRAGYRCRDASCTFCDPVPTTTQPTPPPPPSTAVAGSTSTAKTTVPQNDKIRDTQWFLVIIALLCAGIALVVMTKIKPILHWIRSNHGYFLPEKTVTAPLRAVDDDVSKPVQEVCGKCDHCIDLCIKD